MKYTILASVLIFVGTVKVFTDIFGLEKLSAVAAVTNAAPAMKVFTAHKGYETYSAKFEISVTNISGDQETFILNRHNYSGLKGPYNRRNVYGALIAYGPVLVSNSATKEMWQVMASNAFCKKQGVLNEIGLTNDQDIKSATITYLRQIKSSANFPNQLTISCV